MFRQFTHFHTLGPLNRYEDNERIQKAYEHYADDPKPNELSKSLNRLAQTGRIDDAIAEYEKSKQHQQDDSVTLTMMHILMKAERLSAAKELALNYKPHESTSSSQTNAVLCSIFDRLAHHSDLDELNFFFENLVFKRKYVGRTVLEAALDGLLRKNADTDRILDIFERMANQFHETPLFHSIACELIRQNDTEHLGRLLDICTKVHGRDNSLYSMAFALNACNCIDQARKIFVSFGPERESERLEQCIENLRLRQQTKLLENLLAVTRDCVPQRYREQMYTGLLELYGYQQAKTDIARICSAMDEEKIVPAGQMLGKLTQIFKRNGINVPDSWQPTLSHPPDDSTDGHGSDSVAQLESLLDANDLQKANALFLQLLQGGKSLNRRLIRHCLLKNAEHANVDLFQHLTTKLDASTKIQLNFHRYECIAYLKAKKCDEYLQMVRVVVEQNGNDLKTVAAQLPLNLIDMIDSSPDIYEQCKYFFKSLPSRILTIFIKFSFSHRFNASKTLCGQRCH